jgi:hypothetical protein
LISVVRRVSVRYGSVKETISRAETPTFEQGGFRQGDPNQGGPNQGNRKHPRSERRSPDQGRSKRPGPE